MNTRTVRDIGVGCARAVAGYLTWCFRLAVRGILMVSGEDFRGDP